MAVGANAGTLYVSTSGSDSNPGTSSQPLRTITQAYNLASAGTTIMVMPGTYTDYQSGWGLHLGKNGTASSPITLKSQTQGAAVLDGQNASDRNIGIYIDGTYNIVDGFEIKNGTKGGISIWANNNQILNCNIHNNGNPAMSGTDGHNGIYSSDGTAGNVYRANYIRDNGRSGTTLDHGLYLCGQNEVVNNNIVTGNPGNGLQIAGYTTVANMKVYNNVFAFNGANGIILWQALSGVDIKNNIIYQNGHYAIGSYDAHGSGINVDHNLSYGNGYGNFSLADGGSDFSYNLGNAIYSDPGLVNPSSSTFDPHLKSGSPGVQSAVNLYSTFTTDKAGALRQSSGSWDLGVYKYGSTSSGDTTAPTVSITSPGNGATISGTVTVSCNAADNVGVASVQFQCDGANIGSALTTSPYSVSMNTASYQNGSHTLTAIARDAAGNQTTSASVTVTIANAVASLPTVSVAATVPTAVLGGANNGTFTFTRTGSTSSPLNVNYSLGGTAVKWNDYYRSGIGDMPVSITIPAGSAAYTMNIAARDNQTHANPETVILALSADPSYQVGTPSSATMTIVSNAPPASPPATITLQISKTLGGGIKFTWNSVAGKVYRVASKANMISAWKDLSSNVTATGTTTSWTDTIMSHTNQQFYTVYSTN